MNRRHPSIAPDVVSQAVARAIALKGSQQKLAVLCDVSQAEISRVKRRGRLSAQLAIAIHRATGGDVPGSLLRPDLWRRAQDVPVEVATALVEPQSAPDAGGASVDRGEHLLGRVGQGADRSEQGDHGALFRLPEGADGVLIEILARDAPRQELDAGEAGAEHLAQVDRNDERACVTQDRRHGGFPVAVRIGTANYLNAKFSVDEKDRIVNLLSWIVLALERARRERTS
jgi:DNA-binding transcriptional regulator YdaS (Cro superfamily)